MTDPTPEQLREWADVNDDHTYWHDCGLDCARESEELSAWLRAEADRREKGGK